jgi:hypothetical protein
MRWLSIAIHSAEGTPEYAALLPGYGATGLAGYKAEPIPTLALPLKGREILSAGVELCGGGELLAAARA